GRYPGIVSVHGHWAWARIDPHVQPRCIGLAKLGYVVLSLDAFGAGERAIEPGPGTYHGALVAASLWPVGTPLIGLQVYDNRRAVDYLVSRPEVDPAMLAITGASVRREPVVLRRGDGRASGGRDPGLRDRDL